MNTTDLQSIVEHMARTARAHHQARGECTLPDGTHIELILQAPPTPAWKRLLTAIRNQNQNQNQN